VTDEVDAERAANEATESGAPSESDADAASWWSIEGETTGERVRDGLPQLAIIVVTVWLGTSIAYNVLSEAFDPISATASIVIGSLYVGLRLRRWLTVDDGEERGGEPGGDAADERENASDVDAADEQASESDADAASAE